ncbi:MAG: chemotaxis protein CheW [Desulfobulbaceae bacterium]|nr:chemotaxis protein CheW [Desulfobulbaceae bacterium]
MGKEQLFATFILNSDIEIAITATQVVEAVTISDKLLPLPGGVDYLAGMMNLRGTVIPVINLKKRLGIGEDVYAADKSIAVVQSEGNIYGLLFENIKEVLPVESDMIVPVHPSLQSDDRIISGIIKLDNGRRLLEILDLNLLLPGSVMKEISEEYQIEQQRQSGNLTIEAHKSERYLVFSCNGMEYGVNVEDVQEITPLTELNNTFQSGSIKGAIELRGKVVPVIDSHLLLNGSNDETTVTPDSRVVVLFIQDVYLGILVNAVQEIRVVEENTIIAVPFADKGKGAGVLGMLDPDRDRNIMLLDMGILLKDEFAELESVAQIKDDSQALNYESKQLSHHLITENSYLVFKVERDFAVELHHVQEILENCRIMPVPDMNGFRRGIINLRGQMVPVIDLRHFLGYPLRDGTRSEDDKYVVAQSGDDVVALIVDDILTIQKQQKYFHTPSLNPQLRPRQDALDRTIEMMTEDEISKNVLVINVHNLIMNHL